MKINYVGIVAGIIALISIAFPWWTMTMSAALGEIAISADVSIYLYQTTASVMGISATVSVDTWFCFAALALVLIAGISGIVGSVIIGKIGKMVLVVAGVLALLSLIIFVVGLQNELSKAPPVPGFPSMGLFSSGSFTFMETISAQYSTYLTFGFWMALVATILAFVSVVKHPVSEFVKPPEKPS